MGALSPVESPGAAFWTSPMVGRCRASHFRTLPVVLEVLKGCVNICQRTNNLEKQAQGVDKGGGS